VDLEGPHEQEVLVEIKATSVCRSDLNGVRDPGGPFPVILGHEGAGIVREIGPRVTHVKVGDPVVLSWLPACGECYYCRHHQPFLCETAFGPMCDGTLMDGTLRFSQHGKSIYHYALLSTFARHTVVPARSCVRLPQGMPWDKACLLGCGVATGWGAAVKAAKVEAGSTVGVFGVGGVGIAAVLGARFCGATQIIAVDCKKSNLDPSLTLGATHAIHPENPEIKQIIDAMTRGRGLDFAIDATGHEGACRQAYELTRKGGTVVVVGAFHQPTLALPAMGFHRQGKILKGSFYGDIDPVDGLRELADLYLAGGLPLDPLVRECVPLAQVNDILCGFDDPCCCNVGRSVIVF
jgi:S-(hydroxymethyl)glutathione dehydrogenase/alcohol dehydrogenase